MKKRIVAATLCTALALPMVFSLSGHGITAQAADHTEAVEAKVGIGSSDMNLKEKKAIAITDFGVRLFQRSMKEGENTLISPMSVLEAMAMTANGAKGETLSQMEEVFGLPVADLNDYLHTYRSRLPVDDRYKISIANAIWLKDDFSVKPDFLQTNEKWYDASCHKAPFDNSTLKHMNSWVSSKTDGMIENILDKISEDAMMYLVNAIAFDAEWQKTYDEYQVRNGVFTRADGTKQDVELMHSEEHQYLEDSNAIGFIKYYADRKYAFAALLPNEGMSVAEYAATLSGERIHSLLSNMVRIRVKAAIPKFESEYSVEMSEILKAMGMANAFDQDAADFSGIAALPDGNLFINRVLHKTFIGVHEKGTKAGASTVVEISLKAAAMRPDEEKVVYLDRPFVYMLIDCEENLPLFIGTVMDMGK